MPEEVDFGFSLSLLRLVLVGLLHAWAGGGFLDFSCGGGGCRGVAGSRGFGTFCGSGDRDMSGFGFGGCGDPSSPSSNVMIGGGPLECILDALGYSFAVVNL